MGTVPIIIEWDRSYFSVLIFEAVPFESATLYLRRSVWDAHVWHECCIRRGKGLWMARLEWRLKMHSNAEMTSRVSEKAHEAVDKMAEKASDLEQQARQGMHAAAERAHDLREEAEREARQARGAIERFMREQPVTTAALAFAAGVITTTLLRR
jgi:ElaB/YqjD/DUF883 family membrane-anchored ribosome-binding protein